ncbi:MAG: hypothetical protein ABR926_01900 [Streptosporangiaceae bacterium]
MLPGATDSADDPLEQDAPGHPVDDPALVSWFLGDGDRANRATDLRTFTIGNRVQPLVDGRSYFTRLHAELNATEPGDQVYFLDFRGDLDELLDGPGSAVGDVLGRAARRGVKVFGLLWRSQPTALRQSEEANAEFVREIDEDGGQVLLDARTRRAGSHHQKLVVIRHPGATAGATTHTTTATRRRWTSRTATAPGRRGMTSRPRCAGRPCTTWSTLSGNAGTEAASWTCPARSASSTTGRTTWAR